MDSQGQLKTIRNDYALFYQLQNSYKKEVKGGGSCSEWDEMFRNLKICNESLFLMYTDMLSMEVHSTPLSLTHRIPINHTKKNNLISYSTLLSIPLHITFRLSYQTPIYLALLMAKWAEFEVEAEGVQNFVCKCTQIYLSVFVDLDGDLVL